MRAEKITSRTNPLMVRMRKLKSSRQDRDREGVFLCEGPKMLSEALKWNASIETVVYAGGAVLPELNSSVRVVEVPEDLLTAVADTRTPQGIVFLCRGGERILPDGPGAGRFLVLDGVQDPGNVGTIWRTADAFQADGLILCNGCADPWNPKTVRATMGAVFRFPVYECTVPQLWKTLREWNLPLYAADLGAEAADVRNADLSRAAVVIGSEGRGVSGEVRSLCGKSLRIPMKESCESLNAAVAASVILWEMFRNDPGNGRYR